MLRAVGITDPVRRAKAYPFEMSGGMCQRVMIAIALAAKPSLLIADEPTTGLDVTTQAVIMDLINDLAANSAWRRSSSPTILRWPASARRASWSCMPAMSSRRRRPESCSQNPRHPYTAELIAATPDSATSLDELAAIPGSLPDLRRTDLPPCRYSERCPRKIDGLRTAVAAPARRSRHTHGRLLESAARARDAPAHRRASAA